MLIFTKRSIISRRVEYFIFVNFERDCIDSRKTMMNFSSNYLPSQKNCPEYRYMIMNSTSLQCGPTEREEHPAPISSIVMQLDTAKSLSIVASSNKYLQTIMSHPSDIKTRKLHEPKVTKDKYISSIFQDRQRARHVYVKILHSDKTLNSVFADELTEK